MNCVVVGFLWLGWLVWLPLWFGGSLWLGTFCAGLYLWCRCLLVLFVLGVVLVDCLLWCACRVCIGYDWMRLGGCGLL